MAVDLLEIQRARKALEAFCTNRNPALRNSGRQLCCQRDGEDLMLVETAMPGGAAAENAARPLVRLSYQNGCWLVFCPDQGSIWAPYPHLPRAESIEQVMRELEQAPLHVHWS